MDDETEYAEDARPDSEWVYQDKAILSRLQKTLIFAGELAIAMAAGYMIGYMLGHVLDKFAGQS